MKFSVIRLILTVVVLSWFACASIAAQEKPIPVAGTKVSLTPPAEFKPSSRFPGFAVEESQASIMVTEMPAPYATLVQAFTSEGLETRGMSLISRREVKLGGKPAILFHLRQVAQSTAFLKWLAMTGNERETVLITGTFPETAKDRFSATVETSVLSAVWNTEAKVDPLEGLNFAIEEQPDLKFARRLSNMILLTKDGTLPGKPTNDPMLAVGSSLSEVEIQDVKSFADRRLRQITQVSEPVIETQRTLTIAGLPGSEIIAKAVWKAGGQEPVAVFQIILLDGKNYFLLQGFAPFEERKKYLEIFGKIAQSFRKK